MLHLKFNIWRQSLQSNFQSDVFLFLKNLLFVFFSSALVDTHYTCTVALDHQLHLTDICTSGCMGKFDPIFFKQFFSISVNHVQLNLHLLMRNQLQRHSRNWKIWTALFSWIYPEFPSLCWAIYLSRALHTLHSNPSCNLQNCRQNRLC